MINLDPTFLDNYSDALIGFLNSQKVIAPILLLALEEAGIPLPVPGDLIIAYTGYQVAQGNISYQVAFILILISVLIGSTILYGLSFRFGNRLILTLGKYIHLDEKKLLTVEKHFRKYGILAIIFGRHIPGFRVPVTVFSGISDVSYKTFIASTFVSVIFWIIIYLSLGLNLGAKTMALLHAHTYLRLFLFLPFILFFGLLFYLHKTKNK